ncbi:tripartite tricarboxylate transporter permease [Salipiger profundus]|uniref:tripartite tricarboxylate transporter permease n=1 Tax=Salipiger profundus TaxID=1229727 RepID=UPI0008E11FB8|nr:tripartite tricarboxylate transporter permease [Salipiger profundus]SFD94649.1 TctA family transporter [Salipiger profundus]
MDTFNIVLPALSDAWALIIQPATVTHLILGVIMGLAVGIIPGLGGIAGLSLLLPFMFGMEPVEGLALMVGLIAVVPTSDTFASVLMGVPGSSSSQATVLDGFPLAKQGQAARALSAAFAASLFGGLIGAFFLTFFIVIARPLVLSFGLPEMLMVSALGLSMVSILAGRVPMKGLASAGIGIMFGTVGIADAGGSLRMASYSIPYLTDGIPLEIFGLGIFAIPEIVNLLRKNTAISSEERMGQGWYQGVRDWTRNKALSIRCALIGVVVGVIPGLGGSVVDWIAYGHAVQSSKDKSMFGKGEIRGVIAPESANNAKEGGGLVPTLLFGIPGSGSMAIFIGAIALLGNGDIEVGPSMLKSNLDVTYSIVWMLALANVFGTLISITLADGISRLTSINFSYVAPFLFTMICFAAFQSGQSFGDLLALFLAGLLGVLLKRFDWSRPAFLIGFVLSRPIENLSNQAYQVASFKLRMDYSDGLHYIFSPIVISLLLIIGASVFIGLRQSKSLHTEGEAAGGPKLAPGLFLAAVTAYLVVAVVDASSISNFNLTDKIVPMTVGIASILCCLVLAIQMARAPAGHMVFADSEHSGPEVGSEHGLFPTLSWFAGLILGTYLLGFFLALMAFFVLFLRHRAKASWLMTLALTGAGLGLITGLAWLLNRDLPPGLLQQFASLPWPLT